MKTYNNFNLSKALLIFNFWIVLFFVFSGCSKEDAEEVSKEVQEKTQIQQPTNEEKKSEAKEDFVNFSITKIEDEKFGEDDSIGVFCPKAEVENRKKITLTQKEGKWIPQVKRDELGSGAISFYYPMADVTEETISLKVEIEQNKEDNYKKSIFLFARVGLEEKSEVSATLKNVMHELEIYIEGDVPSDLSIKVKSVTEGSFSLSAGEVSISESELKQIVPSKKENGVYSVMILPQPTKTYKESGLIEFIWNEGKDKMSYKVSEELGDTFVSGEKTSLKIILKSETEKESEENASIDGQTQGIGGNNGNDNSQNTEGNDNNSNNDSTETGNDTQNDNNNSKEGSDTKADQGENNNSKEEDNSNTNSTEGTQNRNEGSKEESDTKTDQGGGNKSNEGNGSDVDSTNENADVGNASTETIEEKVVNFSIRKGNEEFSNGTTIGVYCSSVNKFFTLTKENGKWMSSVKRNELGNGKLSFYYPVGGTKSEKYSIEVETDQRKEIDYKSNQFYFGQVNLGENDNNVNISLKNILHELEINIKGNIPSDVSINLGNIYQGNISLVNGEVTLPTTIQALIKPYKKSEGKYSVIIIPQSTEPYKKGLGLMDVVWNNGDSKMKNYKLKDSKTFFEKGGKTVINITLEDKKVVVPPKGGGQSSGIGGGSGNSSGSNGNGSGTQTGSGSENSTTPKVDERFKNKSIWVYGVNAPQYPVGENNPQLPEGNVKGKWMKDAFGLTEIRWKEGDGWYDINKAKPNDRYSDNHLCWAASASNMLHWWIKHNQKYIDKYYKQYPDEKEIPDIDYNVPENYSKIFDLFTKTFDDRGSWTNGGIKWFLTGERDELPAFRNLEDKNFKGYFSKVFGNKIVEKLLQRHSWPNKQRFNRIIKDALENNKGLYFDVHIKDYGNHAMTIWGAEFDENGDVSYIYYCDNNSNEEVNKEGICTRRKIIYENNKTYYVPRDSEKFKNQIIAIYSLDLGTNIWKETLGE